MPSPAPAGILCGEGTIMVVEGEADAPAQRSHQFLLRMWPEDQGGGRADWRGSVRHVSSGEVRYFRDWQTLEAFVVGLLGRAAGQGPGTSPLSAGDPEQTVPH